MKIKKAGRVSLGSELWDSCRGGVDFYQSGGNLIAITEPIRKNTIRVTIEDTLEEKLLIAVSLGYACTSYFEVYNKVEEEAEDGSNNFERAV